MGFVGNLPITKMNSFISFKVRFTATGALLILLVSGCNRDGIKVYHVDTNESVNPALPPVAAPATPTAMPANMPPGLPTPDKSGLPQLQYTVPAGWEQKAASAMRVASFGVSQNGKLADISVIPLGGMAGTDPANVNRWRGQVGLAPLADDDLSKLADKVTVGDAPADLFDLTGTAPGGSAPERILAVILHRDDNTWFFKMTGDATLVEQEKPAFEAFLKSVAFGATAAPATPSGMDMSQLPSGHPPVGGMSLGSQNSLTPDANTTVVGGNDNGKPTWTVPAGWQTAPLEQFLIAKFVIPGASGAQAAVNVSSLNGNGGGLLPNLNRWRAQLGLAPAAESDVASLPTFDAGGGKATVVDVTGTSGGQPARLVGVVLPLGGQTWFYKLMGDADIVTQQKDALVKFVQSAQYPAGQ